MLGFNGLNTMNVLDGLFILTPRAREQYRLLITPEITCISAWFYQYSVERACILLFASSTRRGTKKVDVSEGKLTERYFVRDNASDGLLYRTLRAKPLFSPANTAKLARQYPSVQ